MHALSHSLCGPVLPLIEVNSTDGLDGPLIFKQSVRDFSIDSKSRDSGVHGEERKRVFG